MDRERLRTLSRIEHGHFWFAGRDLLLDRLTARYGQSGEMVLDIGAGTGRWVERLTARGYRAVGLDLSAVGGDGRLTRADATCLPFPDSTFGTVFLLDLLEHVDDGAVLREVRRVVRPGGCAILSVPAFPWLWSYRDEAAGHLRRYTGATLRRAVESAGLVVEERRYYQFLLFPLLAVSRLMARQSARQRDREDLPPLWLNSLLARLNRAEASWSDSVRWPWGSSLIAVCRRNMEEK
jgi:SAM-dependent methyltransferase